MQFRAFSQTHAATLCAALAFAAFTNQAVAQRGGNIDLSGFRPAMDSRGYLTLNASNMLGHLDVSFGIGALDWGYNLLSFENGTASYEVAHIITATLVAAMGFKLGPIELEPGVSVPIRIMYGDRNPDDPGLPAISTDDKRFKLSGQGLGNVGLHLKTRLLKTTNAAKLGLGVVGSVYLNTPSPTESWLGDTNLVPQVVGILDKEFGQMRRFRMAVNAGIRLRPGVSFTDNGADGATPTTRTIRAGKELPYGLALAWAMVPQKVDLIAEVFGAHALDTTENYQPLEAIVGGKFYLARNSFFSLGAGRGLLPGKGGNPDARVFVSIIFEPNIGDRDGDGLKDDVDKCPDDPEDFDGFKDEDGCPDPDNDRDGILDKDDDCPNDPETMNGHEDEDGCPDGTVGDRDGDGIPDELDKCPDEPEDKDGFEDEDGCPDPDNDKDGILDVDDLCPDDPEDVDGFQDQDGCPEPDNDKDRILDGNDKCPNDPETYNGTEDEDGCPDRGRVIVTDTGIEILDMVYFETAKAIIKPESYPILDAVAATLNGNPGIMQIEVQGHTDERGDDAYNLELSDKRAHSVRQYLIDKGVDAGRLSAQGYGENQPIIRESNAKAWAKNRRVAFLIIKRATE